MRVAIVVPWRGGDPQREANWAYCRPWWDQFGWPIYQVHHTGRDPFNRAWCINEGARRAFPFDAIVVVDADVVEESHQQVRDAVDLCLARPLAFTIAHDMGKDLSSEATALLHAGEEVKFERHIIAERRNCESRVNVISAELMERLGGYDTRFEGWGHEDVAFCAAAATLADFQRVPGTCYHLWHEPQLPRSRRTIQWKRGNILAGRYRAAANMRNPVLLDRVLNERADVQKYVKPFPTKAPSNVVDAEVGVLCLTSGRREYLERTIASFNEQVKGNIKARIMVDDSGDDAFHQWVRERFPEWRHIAHDRQLGYAESMRSARAIAASHFKEPYVFWLEDDFTFDVPVALDDLATLLDWEPKLAQVILLRGPAYPLEFEAGGIIQEHPHSYVRAVHNGLWYLKHTRFYSSNPGLARREMFEWQWPRGGNTEGRFGKVLTRAGFFFAFFGDGTPMVTHIGEERNGFGY